jgi:hypothetical protein
MSNTNKIITGIVALGVIGMVIFLNKKGVRKQNEEESALVADEGYETAYDILFPIKKSKLRRS